MKKIFFYLIFSIFLMIGVSLITLLTIGVETNKFNKLISNKTTQAKNINLKLNAIKFKLDPKNLNLFLDTQNPKIIYRKISVPAQNLKVYIDFLSLLKTEIKINKVNILLEELSLDQLNKLSMIIKPSNFKSLLNNKIKNAKLISEVEFFFDKKGAFKDFIAKGYVDNLEAEIFTDFNLSKTKLSFFADKNDILIKNIDGNIEKIKIFDGDIKMNLENGVKLSSNFNTKFELDKKKLFQYSKFLNRLNLPFEINDLSANLNNNLSINFDNTYKVENLNYETSGVIKRGSLKFFKPFKNYFKTEEISDIYFSDLKINTSSINKNLKINVNGKYSFDNLYFLPINFVNNFDKDFRQLKINFDYNKDLIIDYINYKKSKNSIATLFIDLEKKKDIVNLNKLNYEEENEYIKLSGVKFKNKKFLSFDKIFVKTSNNDFSIKNNKKIIIKGTKFDASNLAKFLNQQGNENQFMKLNKEIEIDFKNIKVPMSENLQNFKLLGEIKKGKFIKISSKGDFGENNFLDISMVKDENTDKKYLEIYSDLTKPLLTEFSFFNGLSGGKLLFRSTIDDLKSSSKLKIENFKVINAPGVIKLLSLADLRGLVDLAEGDGLSFDTLEIKMEKNKDFLKLNEILALGPSISVLMEGYQEKNGMTSLRGTLIPAKTLNKMIAKVPVLGSIVIPKEAGEGIFGVSFKMKGRKGEIKTTINPIRTLTPRFLQKIIERNKETK